MFKKEDLKFGDIVTIRNKNIYIYVEEEIVRKLGYFLNIDNFDENLQDIDGENEFDIMKVQRYQYLHNWRKGEKLHKLVTLYERKNY